MLLDRFKVQDRSIYYLQKAPLLKKKKKDNLDSCKLNTCFAHDNFLPSPQEQVTFKLKRSEKKTYPDQSFGCNYICLKSD